MSWGPFQDREMPGLQGQVDAQHVELLGGTISTIFDNGTPGNLVTMTHVWHSFSNSGMDNRRQAHWFVRQTLTCRKTSSNAAARNSVFKVNYCKVLVVKPMDYSMFYMPTRLLPEHG